MSWAAEEWRAAEASPACTNTTAARSSADCQHNNKRSGGQRDKSCFNPPLLNNRPLNTAQTPPTALPRLRFQQCSSKSLLHSETTCPLTCLSNIFKHFHSFQVYMHFKSFVVYFMWQLYKVTFHPSCWVSPAIHIFLCYCLIVVTCCPQRKRTLNQMLQYIDSNRTLCICWDDGAFNAGELYQTEI